MTKEKARQTLINYILYGVDKGLEPIPIKDEVVISETTEAGIEQWSFKGLIKIAYDL